MSRPLARALGGVAAFGVACTCQGDPALQAEFRAAKEAALADPGPAPVDWRPDAALHLSPALIDRLLEAGLEGAGPFAGKLELGADTSLRPELALEGVELDASQACEGCLKADVHLKGDLTWRAPLLGKGSVPLTVDATLDIALDTRERARRWVVTARTEKVRKVRLDLGGLPAALAKLAEEPVRKWAEDELRALEPTTITELKQADLPVRALRVAPEGSGGARVDVLTGAVEPGAVGLGLPKIHDGWQLDVAAQSLVWLARAESFRAGPQTPLEVVAVPEALTLKRDAFTLDLRLWRTASPGWWRDYRATGSLAIRDGQAVLEPEQAEQLGASPGAGLADPLALLAEGLIVDTIEAAMRQRLPASGSATVEGWRAGVEATGVSGSADGEAIQIRGALALQRAP